MERKVYINSYAGIKGDAEPDYKDFIPDPVIRRRMSRIIKMGVSSALLALRNSGTDKVDGIITGTGWGCLADTEKFLNSIYENDERLLNPSAFIQSTPNTVGAQVALSIGSKSYNVSYVHGGISFESALIDTMLKLQERNCGNILVGGFDEMSPTKKHILERMGVWRIAKPGEGSYFFVMSNRVTDTTVAELVSVDIPHGHSELKEHIDLSGNVMLLCGAEDMLHYSENLSSKVVNYKENCGEYPTASAYALWYGCTLIFSKTDVDKIIIVTRHLKERMSIITIKRRAV